MVTVMRSPFAGGVACAALLAAQIVSIVHAAESPSRKPLTSEERAAVLALIKSVDLAQETDVVSTGQVEWRNDVLKSGNQTGYVPFRLTLNALPDGFKSAVMYVRAVSRRDGVRVKDERSSLRDTLTRNTTPSRMPETVFVGAGEMPVGGPAAGSSRRAISGPAEAFAVLALQQRDLERQKAAAEAAKKKIEAKERDPFLFPFEDYDVAAVHPQRGGEPRWLERALSLPAGEYDIYVALIDRARLKTSGATVVRNTVTVPDFWSDELRLSTIILAADVRPLAAPLSAQQQREHPYTFGRADVVPVGAPSFTQADVLTVVYQICNYGAPDADLMAEYNFYRVDDGPRRLFNRTTPQTFADTDLPPPAPWETQAFATQAVSLEPFPPGRYELQVTVHDRRLRGSALQSTEFTVLPRR